MSKNLLLDNRWIGAHGIGRFAREVISRLDSPHWRCGQIGQGISLLHPAEALWLSATILRQRPDAYFSPGFNPPLISRCPLLFTIHDLIHLDVPEECTPTKRLFYTAVVRPAARRAFTVFTDSNYSKLKILQWVKIGPNKVKVVGCGIDESFFHETDRYSPGFPYLLYVGNRKPHKNLRRLLAGLAYSHTQTDFRLLISGTVDDELMAEAKRLRIEDRIGFTGFIQDTDLPSYYRGAHAFVFPSLHEGFGLPPVEAMATGTPVLTSNATCLPEVVGNAALTVDPMSVESIAEGLDRICYDSALRSRLEEAGPKRARTYSWDNTASLVRESIAQAMDIELTSS